MNKTFPTLCTVLICISLALSACDNQSETGVVARVNGEPITMLELQARYDLDHIVWSDRSLPPAEELQSQYGDSLSGLIINRLVMQELEKEKLEVTPEEMSLAERDIRADYAEDEFELTLEDDAIDIDMWRNFLRQRLSVQKFMQMVLRPSIRVSPEESAAYYNENVEQFRLPARVHFLILEAVDKKTLEDLLKAYDEEAENIARLLAGKTDVRMREVRMSEDRLSPEWSGALAKLKPGEASKVYFNQGLYEFIILINKQEAAELPLAQAYPLIERELVEYKLESAFEAWVEDKISKADIEIAEPLAGVWIEHRLNSASNATYPKEMPWLDIEENYDPNADPFEDEEARELFEQESNP